MANLEDLVIQLKLETKQLQTGLAAAEGKIKKFGSSAEHAGGGMKKMHKESNELVSGFKKMLGAAAIVEFLLDASKAAAEDSTSFAVLQTQMKNTTGATAKQTKAIDDQLESLGEMSGTKMPELRTSYASLLRATGSSTKAMQLQKQAMDLAAGAHIPLATAAKALGKAVNGNATALIRLDPALKGSKNVLGDLQKQFKGSAKAAGDANPYAKLGVIMEKIKVTLGKALLPLLNLFANLLKKLTPFITMLSNVISKVVTAFMPFIDQLMNALMPVLDVLIKAIMQIVNAVMPPLAQIMQAVVIPAVNLLAKVLSGETIPMIMKLIMAIMPLVNILADELSFWLNLIITIMDKLFTAMKPVYDFVVNSLVKGFKFLTDILGPLWTNVIKPLVDGLMGLLGIKGSASVEVKTKLKKPDPADLKAIKDAATQTLGGSMLTAGAGGKTAASKTPKTAKDKKNGHTINTTVNAKTDASAHLIAAQVVNAIKFNLPVVGDMGGGFGGMGSQVSHG